MEPRQGNSLQDMLPVAAHWADLTCIGGATDYVL